MGREAAGVSTQLPIFWPELLALCAPHRANSDTRRRGCRGGGRCGCPLEPPPVLVYKCAAAWETGAPMEERSHRTVCTRLHFRVHLMGVLLLLLQRPQGQGEALRCDAKRRETRRNDVPLDEALGVARRDGRVQRLVQTRVALLAVQERGQRLAAHVPVARLPAHTVQLSTVHYCGRIEQEGERRGGIEYYGKIIFQNSFLLVFTYGSPFPCLPTIDQSINLAPHDKSMSFTDWIAWQWILPPTFLLRILY